MDAGRAGAKPHHQTRPSRVAQRRLRMGIGEESSPSGQLVDVRSLNQGMPAHTAYPVILIVDRDEENVRLVGTKPAR